jgi:ABC-type multidrug transport system ATPase subunit
VTAAIRTVGLTKRYGSVTAVDGIDLDVQPGDVYGFLGPNGSGKTTTVRMLLGLVLPTSGTVEVLGGRIPKQARSVLYRVGALVEAPAAYGHLGARANLSLLDAAGPGGSRRTRKARIDEALEQVGLAGVGRRPVKAYSLGMRQRLGIAAALLRQPELLILDEPTNGLDPRGIQEIRALLLGLNATGTTVFLSSHLLAEVEHLCKRVGVVDRGRLVLQDTLESLRAPTGSVVVRTPDPEWAVALLDGDLRGRSGDRLVVRAADPAELNARLVGHGIRITELAEERRSLEDVVLAATTGSSDRVDATSAIPVGLSGPRTEILDSDDSVWQRPPPLARRRPRTGPDSAEPGPAALDRPEPDPAVPDQPAPDPAVPDQAIPDPAVPGQATPAHGTTTEPDLAAPVHGTTEPDLAAPVHGTIEPLGAALAHGPGEPEADRAAHVHGTADSGPGPRGAASDNGVAPERGGVAEPPSGSASTSGRVSGEDQP